METMRAFQFVEWQKPAELREVPAPEPGPGQVLVRRDGRRARRTRHRLRPLGCGRCANRRVGIENYCENPGKGRPGGLGRDGGMANYMVVPSTRFLIPLGDVDPREAAPLTDAARTSYHAVKRSLAVECGSSADAPHTS